MAKHMSSTTQRVPTVLVAATIAVVMISVGVAYWLLLGRSATDSGSQASHSDSQVVQSSQNAPSNEGANGQEEGAVSQDDVSASEFARMLRNDEVRSIRLVGDSITAGYGTDGYEEAVATAQDPKVIYDDGQDQYFEAPSSVDCWANAFRKFANVHGISDFVNAGINGAFMKGLANKPEAWLGNGADVIVVALGTNDAGYYGIDEYRADAQAALAAAASKSKLVVVLAPVCDLRPEYLLVEPAGVLGDVLEPLCKENGYLFVDPREAVEPEMFNEDGLHPNTRGSLAIWQCVQQTLGLDAD